MEPISTKQALIGLGVAVLALVFFLVLGKAKPIIEQPISQEPIPVETPTSAPLSDSSKNSEKNMSTVTLTTNIGTITITLDTENTPHTAQNFITLAEKDFYNGTRFHRVIDGFMIQGGDPQSADITLRDRWGTGGPGYQFADEIKPTNNNIRGTISMANAGPNTNGSQFFINTADNISLNPKHTVFGTVVSGMDVVDKISKTPVDERNRPITDVIIQKITVGE